jgi:hypothetical protein
MTSFNSLHDRSSAFGAAENAGLRVRARFGHRRAGWRAGVGRAAGARWRRWSADGEGLAPDLANGKPLNRSTRAPDERSVGCSSDLAPEEWRRRREGRPNLRGRLCSLVCRYAAAQANRFRTGRSSYEASDAATNRSDGQSVSIAAGKHAAAILILIVARLSL